LWPKYDSFKGLCSDIAIHNYNCSRILPPYQSLQHNNYNYVQLQLQPQFRTKFHGIKNVVRYGWQKAKNLPHKHAIAANFIWRLSKTPPHQTAITITLVGINH
jgi:hypothetical protein